MHAEAHELIDVELENFNLPGHRVEHRGTHWLTINDSGLQDFERSIAEDMRGLRVIINIPELGRDDAIALLKDIIVIRRLWRDPPMLSRIIEHPANEDSRSVIKGARELLPAPGGELILSQEETVQLRQEVRGHEDHMRSANRLIGTAWATSGTRYHEWTQGSPLRFREDWALIKLFRKNGQQFQNQFSANLLRPGLPEQSFTGVRQLALPSRIDVTKRGRTTDFTVGTLNGAPSIINLNDDPLRTFAVVSKRSTKQVFSAGGDSGSWIMDINGQLVGMLWGGNTVFLPAGQKKVIWDDLEGYRSHHLDVEDVTHFTPATFFFKKIERSFKRRMRALGHDLPDIFEGRVRLLE